MILNINQVWKENDPRNERHVRVLQIHGSGSLVDVQTCNLDGTTPAGTRVTTVNVIRFNGKRGGYSFVKVIGEAEDPFAACPICGKTSVCRGHRP